MTWAASEGVVPLSAYPYSPRTGDCQPAFDSRKMVIAGSQAVDLSKADTILQVSTGQGASISALLSRMLS